MNNIEKVARAIYLTQGHEPDEFVNHSEGKKWWQTFTGEAKAAIAAMNQWQDISTAEVGEWWLICWIYQTEKECKKIVSKAFRDSEKLWICDDGTELEFDVAIACMPLPTPPEEQINDTY